MNKLRKITMAAIIAALYVVLTFVLAPLAYSPLQLRVSEGLTVLPFFLPVTSIGLTVGCFFANWLSSYGIWDILFGSLASLIAAIATSFVGINYRKRIKNSKTKIKLTEYILAPFPPVIINAIIVGLVITFLTYSDTASKTFGLIFLINFGSLFFSQLISCYLIGVPLMFGLNKTNILYGGK